MPSLFEPCGLSQLMALRYGTVPIVRETGGLKDTVWPYNEFEGTGTGFSFANYNAHEMLHTIRYAERIFYDKKRDWNKIVERGMERDFSWKIQQSNMICFTRIFWDSTISNSKRNRSIQQDEDFRKIKQREN